MTVLTTNLVNCGGTPAATIMDFTPMVSIPSVAQRVLTEYGLCNNVLTKGYYAQSQKWKCRFSGATGSSGGAV